jgi:TRAP-type uncharacterized transport system fused permease subunit
MRRVGFAPDTAGAMLAASGIGAILSPPTLGAAAFLIAEYLRISYLQVLVMATMPTVLYYLSIGLMIEGDTRNELTQPSSFGFEKEVASQVRASHREPAVPAVPVVPAHYLHFASLILVAVLMGIGLSPFRAVFYATLAAVALSFAMGASSGWRRGVSRMRSPPVARMCCRSSPPRLWLASSSAW